MSIDNLSCPDPAHSGPWGWQWRDSVRDLIPTSPSPLPITIKDLMNNIEKEAPGMYRTLTDLSYSRSPECPFVVDEPAMARLRVRIDDYEKEDDLLPGDAQIGMRKSIAAALGERKDYTPGRKIPAAVYICSVDLEQIVDNLCGPSHSFKTSSPDEPDSGSGTVSMDLGSEDDTSSEQTISSKAVGSKSGTHKGDAGVGRVNSSPGRRL